MQPIDPNSFEENNTEQNCAERFNTGAGPSVAPFHASMVETDHGWSITVTPMKTFDALRSWRHLIDPDRRDQAETLVIDTAAVRAVTGELRNVRSGMAEGSQDERSRVERKATRSQPLPKPEVPPIVQQSPPPLRVIAERAQLPVGEVFSDHALAVDELTLRELVTSCPQRAFCCVLVDGPIESGDARAVSRAIENKLSPLAVELRATASLRVNNDSSVTLETRDQSLGLHLVSESFRQYLASLGRRPVSDFNGPETWQMERLLGVSGEINVRPRETDWYSTSVDVGISTECGEHTRPADRSLVYDLPSGTWHDEP
ncbi:MAG: hypothetical protein EA377_11250 [Phycisphaerales bacterium]|nr:MAG: hypothetical protein EA377_11250 [Phycisphaerales bacterium]